MSRRRFSWKPDRGFFAFAWLYVDRGRTREVWVGPFATLDEAWRLMW